MVIIKYIYIDKQVKNLINILCVQLNLYFHLINFLIFFWQIWFILLGNRIMILWH